MAREYIIDGTQIQQRRVVWLSDARCGVGPTASTGSSKSFPFTDLAETKRKTEFIWSLNEANDRSDGAHW